MLSVIDQAAATTGGLSVTGQLLLGGTARLTDTGILTVGASAAATIGPDARLSAAAVTQTGGAMTLEGTLAVTAGFTATGSIALAGGTLSAAGIILNAGATLAGYGILAPTTSIALNGGLIDATGGLLTLGNDVSNAGSIEIGASASLDAVHAVTGGAVAFTGTGAELIINDLGVFTAAVTSFTGHDVIDLIGIAPAQVSTLNGSITAADSLNNRIGGFALTTAASQPAITIVSDGHGGSLVTLGDEMPCFARGTRLLTPTGYRPVEALKPGDAVITAAGGRAAICWIGSRTLDFGRPHTGAAAPVLFGVNSLGPGRPSRPVRLSPLHAVAIAGVLVPAGHLVNGATILRETTRAAVTYYHVELARHDVVLADGLPCETYLDTGNRGALYRELGRRARPGPPCAERVTAGPRLAAIRRQAHEIALAAGYTLTYRPVLRALAAGHTATPEIRMRAGRRVAQLALPAAARSVTLLSRSLSPAETDPESEDRRQLALCLASASLAGAKETPELGDGWLPRGDGDGGIWMGAAAKLLLPRPAGSGRPASTLTLTLAAVVQSWQSPPPKGLDTRRCA